MIRALLRGFDRKAAAEGLGSLPEVDLQEKVAAVQHLLQQKRVEGVMEAVYYCYGSAVDGDIAEFGTMTGRTAEGIAIAMLAVEREYGLTPKRLHLFDSFVGLPEPDRRPDLDSPHVVRGHWTAGGCAVLSKAETDALIASILPRDRYSLIEGWYADTVPQIPATQHFAMLHVDCDLYGSTMDALVPLFECGQISRGAAICFDDWMCNRADSVYGERKAFDELVKRFDVRFSPWGHYTWSANRFIIHDYRRA